MDHCVRMAQCWHPFQHRHPTGLDYTCAPGREEERPEPAGKATADFIIDVNWPQKVFRYCSDRWSTWMERGIQDTNNKLHIWWHSTDWEHESASSLYSMGRYSGNKDNNEVILALSTDNSHAPCKYRWVKLPTALLVKQVLLCPFYG